MSAHEFGLWLAWLDCEPCDPASLPHLWAQQMAALCNGPLTRRDKRMFRPSDFFDPDRWKAEPEQPPKPMSRRDTAAALRAMFGKPKG